VVYPGHDYIANNALHLDREPDKRHKGQGDCAAMESGRGAPLVTRLRLEKEIKPSSRLTRPIGSRGCARAFPPICQTNPDPKTVFVKLREFGKQVVTVVSESLKSPDDSLGKSERSFADDPKAAAGGGAPPPTSER